MHILVGAHKCLITGSFNIRWARRKIPLVEYCCVISFLCDAVKVTIPRGSILEGVKSFLDGRI